MKPKIIFEFDQKFVRIGSSSRVKWTNRHFGLSKNSVDWIYNPGPPLIAGFIPILELCEAISKGLGRIW